MGTGKSCGLSSEKPQTKRRSDGPCRPRSPHLSRFSRLFAKNCAMKLRVIVPTRNRSGSGPLPQVAAGSRIHSTENRRERAAEVFPHRSEAASSIVPMVGFWPMPTAPSTRDGEKQTGANPGNSRFSALRVSTTSSLSRIAFSQPRLPPPVCNRATTQPAGGKRIGTTPVLAIDSRPLCKPDKSAGASCCSCAC